MDCTLYIYIYVYIYYNNKLQAHNYEIYTTHKYIYIYFIKIYTEIYTTHTKMYVTTYLPGTASIFYRV